MNSPGGLGGRSLPLDLKERRIRTEAVVSNTPIPMSKRDSILGNDRGPNGSYERQLYRGSGGK